ncbi:MAG: 3-phosphoglycerate dehydrogenase family protein [Oscillospiraceae bacterium]|nr:3-phosphoglycerate dehydrogenase family protein [Oscillospiraceae bacterium]
MYKVKILNNIKSKELERLCNTKYEVSAEIEAPDAILVRSAKLHDEQFGADLLCIARAGAGVNNIPLERCADEGIVVFNTPGANAQGVVELALCGLFLSARKIIDGVSWVRSVADKGDEVAALVEKQKAQYAGPEILGKTLGVIGLGAIGAKIANSANALGMKVLGYDPYISEAAAKSLSPEITIIDSLDKLYSAADFISLNVPYMEATKRFINRDTIGKMKQGVRIINMARAELVCDDGILEALESGHVACYVTDFPNGRTAGAPGVVAIPHLGASTPESEDNCVAMACDEVIEYVENGNIVNSVNLPAAHMPRSGSPRLCVIYKSAAGVAEHLKSVIAEFGGDMGNMLDANTQKMTHAYIIAELSKVPAGLEDAVRAIDGVTRVRVLP